MRTFLALFCLGVLLVGCSDDAAPHAASATSTVTAPVDVPSCSEVEAFLAINRGITYDYTASTSPSDLADGADVVVDGRLASAEAETGEVVFTIAVDEVLKGEAGRRIRGSLDISVAVDGEEFVRLLPEGARTVAFLYENGRLTGGYQFGGPEGFYVDCPGSAPVHGRGPGWADMHTIDDLVDALSG
jgi:hypothetical protein